MSRYLAAAIIFFALPAHSDDIARGAAFAQENCSRCHAVTAVDYSPNPRSIPLRFLGRLYPIEGLEEALAEGIMVSHEMPEFVLEADEIAPLIVYLDSIQVRSGY
ncbi:c-type cytochrome [Paracoccus aminophilus]|uniref:Cytochrome c class I n=1 Tax=Paracoccus aminophilus JCM 7686 TaxID=1367847 RepID=S5YJD4_PARAH|nr:cytochrome c [Paracoccus aminophilus]AGT11573.1 cytochrome c class I [Paracoccus aminophilus JCM 7686]